MLVIFVDRLRNDVEMHPLGAARLGIHEQRQRFRAAIAEPFLDAETIAFRFGDFLAGGIKEQLVGNAVRRRAAHRAGDLRGLPYRIDQVLASHLVINAKDEPAHRPIGLPLQLAGAAGDSGLDLGMGVGMKIGDGVALRMRGDDLGLQHQSAVRTDRKERAVGGAAFLAKGRQHDIHDGIVIRQYAAQPVIKAAGAIAVGRADKFIVKAEGIKKRLKAGIVMRAKGGMRAKRVANRCQRQSQIRFQSLAIRDIVRHLAKPVHIVRETDKPCCRAGHHLEGMPHHAGPHNLAKGAYMRQTGRAVACLEQHLAIMVHAVEPFDQIARLGKGPGFRVAGDGLLFGGNVGHVSYPVSRSNRAAGRCWRIAPSMPQNTPAGKPACRIWTGGTPCHGRLFAGWSPTMFAAISGVWFLSPQTGSG